MQTTPLGRYLLTERIATGGTAEIFKAKLQGIEGFEKVVVVKRILPHWSANQHFISMLIDEAKIMVRLNHERIVQVHELAKENDIYYIVMEYIAGVDLRKIFEHAQKTQRPLKVEEGLLVIIEMLRGLDYIHKQVDENGKNLSIVHRDISPQNILVTPEGAIKITDFGIAHAASRSYETATGVLKGKFTYMSPEQASGGVIDQRTDLYATGILLYELLTSKRLFKGGTDVEVLERVRKFNPEPLIRETSIPALLKPILIRALQNDPKKRYANASEFLTDLFEARHRLHLNLKPEAIAERVQRILYPYKFFDAGEVQTSEPEPITNGTLVSARKNENINSENEDTRSLLENSKGFPWKLLTTGLFLVLGYLLYSTYFQKNSPSPLSSLSHQNQTSETFSAIAPPITESKKAEPTKAENLSTKAETHSNVPIIKSSILPVSETKSAQQILEEKKKRDEKLKLEKLEKEKRLALKKEMEEKKLTEPSIKTVEKVENKKEEEAKAVTTSGQGSLFVKASPWGKISVSGVVSGSERPVSKMLSYGNYTVSVSYQNVEGQWKTVSRNVRIAKAATSCSANFRPDGTGGISCN